MELKPGKCLPASSADLAYMQNHSSNYLPDIRPEASGRLVEEAFADLLEEAFVPLVVASGLLVVASVPEVEVEVDPLEEAEEAVHPAQKKVQN